MPSKDPEKRREHSRRWYAKSGRAYFEKWRAKNSDRLKAISHRYATSDKGRAYKRIYREENKVRLNAYARQYHRNKPEYARATKQRRRARQLGGNVSAAEIKRLLRLAKTCPDCGLPYTRQRHRTIDHVMPLSRGGKHQVTNLRVICKPCNTRKYNHILHLL